MFTLPRFEQELDTLLDSLPLHEAAGQPRRICVALSGGLDSTVLLVALARLSREGSRRRTVRAIHVDHALHADSGMWADACRRLALQWSVPFDEVRVDARAAAGESPEAAARAARYDALAARLGPGETLLTAHHADDQLETILLQWLRGGGLRAVAGMAPLARFGNDGWHARPLLAFTRDELHCWASEHGLRWQEDPSNVDRRFDRNYLRHEVLPALRRRWPAAARTAGRVAEHARDALELEATVARQDLERVQRGRALDLDALNRLPQARQGSVLRLWLARLGLPMPSAQTLAALRRDMAVAAPDRIPEVDWPGAIVRRYRNLLYAERRGEPECREGDWRVNVEPRYQWSDESSLELVEDIGVGLSRARMPDRLAVRRRTGGEVFRPAGNSHRRPLRKWLQERDVLPWRRENLPLVYSGTSLVAVADLGFGGDFAAQPGEPSWRIAWHRKVPVTAAEVAAFKWPEHPPIR